MEKSLPTNTALQPNESLHKAIGLTSYVVSNTLRITIKRGKPQTNGMVEGFNGRIATLLKETRFEFSGDLAATLERYQRPYNQIITQKALNYLIPLDKIKNTTERRQKLFRIRLTNRP